MVSLTRAAIASDLASLAGFLTSSLAIDVVAVYNQDSFQQVFQDGRPLKANVRKFARVMEYPVENGSVIADHKVIWPQTVDLPLLIPSSFFNSTYNEIVELFKNATKLIVQTKVDVMRNFIIEDMSHDEKPEIYDAITMTLRLKEVLLIISPTIYAPEDPVQTNTVARGQVISAPQTPAKDVIVTQALKPQPLTNDTFNTD